MIDDNGFQKSTDEIASIKNAIKPSNVTKLNSFLRQATYYGKNISQLL